MTPEQIISGYITPLWDYGFPRDVECTVFATKYLPGGDPADGTMPLVDCLLEKWPTDLHFAQYAGPNVRCVKAGGPYILSFKFAAVDFDFGGHERRPTRDDFANLARLMWVMGVHEPDVPTPSVLYETRGGARAIWLISEINDADEFERHYEALVRKLDGIVARVGHGYCVDISVRDWTRLYRSALVVRDGREEYDRMVGVFHTDEMDLRTFKPKKKPERKPPVGNLKYTAHDARLLQLIQVDMQPGNRNNALFAGLCHVYRKYDGDGAAKWIENLREAALSAGIDESEFASANKSAQKQKGRN